MDNNSDHPNQTMPRAEEAAPAEPVPLEMADVTVGSMKRAEQVVLEGVTWAVHTGEFWAVGGLQASGKSDLLATAAGLLSPLRGSCRVFGRELASGYEHERLIARLRIGLVFDGGRPFGHLNLLENILLPLRYHQRLTEAELLDQAKAWLEMIGLYRHAESMPASLGLNWQQRVGLARALVLKPDILLLDNPLRGLDPVHTAWWLNLLDQLAAGHPLLENRPLPLVATGDDLRPWRNHARQFAILKDKHFIVMENRPGAPMPEDAMVNELLGRQPAKQ